jgi:flagellar protein FlaG
MTIGDIQVQQASGLSTPREGPQASIGPEQAARNREVVRAIKTINEGGSLGPSSELRFAIDRDTGQTLIRIVDRVTNEVISQLPPEVALRAAEVLKRLQHGERVA